MADTLTMAEVLDWLGQATLDRLHAAGAHPWIGLGPYSGQAVYSRRELHKALARAGGRGKAGKAGPLVPASGRGGGYRVDVEGSPDNFPGGKPVTATDVAGRAVCGGCHGTRNCVACDGTGERVFGACLVCGGDGACPLCAGVGFRDRPAGSWVGTGSEATTVTSPGRRVSERVERAFRRMLRAAERLVGRLSG
jgi:hypothetical protein